ncbi:hypothetical protein [Sphingobium algorifonticola]|jgi:predicted metalloprotease with PDZ domain|uniref:M61 family peptidase n=1 Tax=Sphingobium algorifonticola TaxID=2008318 RepID=A0A437J4T7_9SPHN|nr:hypothetical protein [Sphingobium algorifonticola]RVT39588.1 hypothetical protein ENE74_14580 [Sphingobium algorifonticola]
MAAEPARTLPLSVDARDTDRAIFRVAQTIPLEPGAQVVLALAKWIPAYHAPRGAIDFLAGFEFSVGGEPCRWTRDPLDPFRLAIDVPEGASELRATFQGLTPTEAWQGRVVVSDDMLRLDWGAVCLYPARVDVDSLEVRAELRLPDGWLWATALDAQSIEGSHLAFAPTSLRRLLDSPVMAGRHAHIETLDPAVKLTIVADRADQLPRDDDVLGAHRRLIAEADALFGARPFARYDFLMSLSEQTGTLGLEHRACCECGVRSTYFSQWDVSTTEHDLLPHEYVHAWIGKYRVPSGNLHSDFSSMTDELMWVYEGLTQFYGHVLAARCGLISVAHTLEAFALIYTTYDTRPGRRWRPLADTDMDPIFTGREPQPWTSWQRSEDYYGEGLLIWLEIDAMIREGTGGQHSLDDFARAFFGPPTLADWQAPASAYSRADIIAALDAILSHPWEEYSRAAWIGLHPARLMPG